MLQSNYEPDFRPHCAMTIERARELLATQARFGGGYQRNGARLVLAEVQREHGQQAVDSLIAELRLDEVFGFTVGSSFAAPGSKRG